MKRFFIFTSKYEGLLNNFSEKAAAEKIIYIKNFSECVLEISIANREKFCDLLLALLFDIAEAENPVYKYSAKLRETAREIRKTPLCEKELRRLKKFVFESKELHLEGYVTFRMDEFNEKLDMMIYSLAKKLKFGNRE